MHEHTIKHFDRQLAALDAEFLGLGQLCMAQLAALTDALREQDIQACRRIGDGDGELDRIFARIEEQALRLLALRQPLAGDLRQIIAIMRSARDLERIGDYANNISSYICHILERGPSPEPQAVLTLLDQVGGQLERTLDAYRLRDAERALAIRDEDAVIDAHYVQIFQRLLEQMENGEQPSRLGVHALLTIRSLERIGDHIVNVTEDLVLMVTGRYPRKMRQKQDRLG